MNDITFYGGIEVAIVAMSIVFLILILIMTCLVFFKHLAKFEKEVEVKEEKRVVEKPVNKLDVNDEDMVVACLIATIEASNEYGCELKVVNVRELGVG